MDMEQTLNKHNYMVTGACGFIGMHLCLALLKAGCKVVGVDNMNAYYDVGLKHSRLDILKSHDGFAFKKLDISSKEEMSVLFQEHKPDVVVNLAAQAGVRYSLENPEAYIQSNIVGFSLLVEQCVKNNVKHLLYASSSSVYGNNAEFPFKEGADTDKPISLYAASKKSNELIAYAYSHLYRLATTGLRFFTVYGPYGRPDMALFIFTKAIIKGEPIKVFNNGDMFRDFTYVDDIVESILKLIDKSGALELNPPHKIYNIGCSNPQSLMYFIECLEKRIGKKAIIEYLPMQKGDVSKTYADTSDLSNDIGYAPSVDIASGIDKFVSWYTEYSMSTS